MLPILSFFIVIATALLTLSFLYTMQNSGIILDSSTFDKLPVKLASYQLNTSFFWDVEMMKESLITTSAMSVVCAGASGDAQCFSILFYSVLFLLLDTYNS